MKYINESEILEIFDIEKKEDLFLFRDSTDYKSIKYRNLNRDECAMLVYQYKKNNCQLSFAILFEESFIIFKRHLIGKKHKTLLEKVNGKITHTEDLFQDFYIFFHEAVNNFQIVENHSFKKYIDLSILGFIGKTIREKYFFVCKTPQNKNRQFYDITNQTDTLSNQYLWEKVQDSMTEEELVEQINDDYIRDKLSQLCKENKIKADELEIFIKFHGLFGNKYRQKELAQEYNISISYVSKKISKIEKILKNSDLINLFQATENINIQQNKRKKIRSRRYDTNE